MNIFGLEMRKRFLSFRDEFWSNHPFPELGEKTPNAYVKMEPDEAW